MNRDQVIGVAALSLVVAVFAGFIGYDYVAKLEQESLLERGRKRRVLFLAQERAYCEVVGDVAARLVLLEGMGLKSWDAKRTLQASSNDRISRDAHKIVREVYDSLEVDLNYGPQQAREALEEICLTHPLF